MKWYTGTTTVRTLRRNNRRWPKARCEIVSDHVILRDSIIAGATSRDCAHTSPFQFLSRALFVKMREFAGSGNEKEIAVKRYIYAFIIVAWRMTSTLVLTAGYEPLFFVSYSRFHRDYVRSDHFGRDFRIE